MLAEAIAGARDLNDDGTVQQPVEEPGSDDRVAENFTSVQPLVLTSAKIPSFAASGQRRRRSTLRTSSNANPTSRI